MNEDSQDQGAAAAEYGSLAEAAAAYELSFDEATLERLDQYRQILWDWNQQINLTRHTTFDKFAGRDLVDSLQLADHIDSRRRVMDVGSGGGVPGLILAICRPDLRVTLCESTQKKARVLQSMVETLKLPVTVAACRAEELLQLQTFDVLTARAVAPLSKLLYWLAPHWEAFDELLLIKGKAWVDERAEARHRGLLKPLELRKVASYQSPIGESYVLRIWPRESVDEERRG